MSEDIKAIMAVWQYYGERWEQTRSRQKLRPLLWPPDIRIGEEKDA